MLLILLEDLTELAGKPIKTDNDRIPPPLGQHTLLCTDRCTVWIFTQSISAALVGVKRRKRLAVSIVSIWLVSILHCTHLNDIYHHYYSEKSQS